LWDDEDAHDYSNRSTRKCTAEADPTPVEFVRHCNTGRTASRRGHLTRRDACRLINADDENFKPYQRRDRDHWPGLKDGEHSRKKSEANDDGDVEDYSIDHLRTESHPKASPFLRAERRLSREGTDMLRSAAFRALHRRLMNLGTAGTTKYHAHLLLISSSRGV
jgi:hypothetical protein